MNAKYNLNIIKNICKLHNYDLISEFYTGYHNHIIVKDEQGYIYSTYIGKIINNKNLQAFGKHNSYTIQNIKLWCKLNNKLFELISDTYISPYENLQWKCLKKECGENFNMPWSRISQSYGCAVCHGKQVGLSNCLAIKCPDIASEWHSIKNGNLTPYDVTYGSRKDIWWICNECKNEWKVKINSRTSFDSGCPRCNKSKGEKRISEILTNNNINFLIQKTFNELLGLGNRQLSYDFYLPEYNLLIEYQGEQHKKYCKGFYKSKKDFERQQEHDKRKREYAKINNINLLEIWYWDFDNIPTILLNVVNSKQNNNIIING